MMREQKGITLVALIITIIVMLILVGVSISVALNGGLFGKAEEAADSQKAATIKEALALAKTEIMFDYHAGKFDKTTFNAAKAQVLVNGYLEESVTLEDTATAGKYKVTGTSLELDISALFNS